MNVRVISEVVQNQDCLSFVRDLLGESTPLRQAPLYLPTFLFPARTCVTDSASFSLLFLYPLEALSSCLWQRPGGWSLTRQKRQTHVLSRNLGRDAGGVKGLRAKLQEEQLRC